jgi:hypothetical protein
MNRWRIIAFSIVTVVSDSGRIVYRFIQRFLLLRGNRFWKSSVPTYEPFFKILKTISPLN